MKKTDAALIHAYANSLSASDRAALAQLIQFSEQIAALRARQRHLQTGDASKAVVLEALGLAADIAALRQQQAKLAARIIASIPSEYLEPDTLKLLEPLLYPSEQRRHPKRGTRHASK